MPGANEPPNQTPNPGLGRRGHGRRNVVGSSPHRDDYVRLMEAGWSCVSLERYAALRYGEDIPERTFRLYRQRAKVQRKNDALDSYADVESLDVVTERAKLIQLQKARIAVDVDLEIGETRGMNKLLSTTKEEIRLLSTLLTEHKADLQDLGLMPKSGDKVEVSYPDGPRAPAEGDFGRARSLAELLGADPAAEADLAKVLHLAQFKAGSNGSNGTNGAKVTGG